MGRLRKKEDRWMPPRVYRGKSAFEYRPPSGGCIKLCPLNARQSTVWQRYEEELAKSSRATTFAAVIERFFLSDAFKELRERTQKDYRGYAKRTIKPVFGHMNPRKITRKMVAAFLQERGKKSKDQANKEKAFMSAVITWAMSGELYDLPFNPCHGVKAFVIKSRDRYIEDWEYELVYQACDPVIRGAMEVAYRCGSRVGDIAALKKDDLLEEGIFIWQAKTNKKQIKKWNPYLRKAIDDALAAHNSAKVVKVSPYVFNSVRGTRFTSDGLSKKWAKYRDKVRKQTGHPLDFTFHDLKAKAISDFEGTRQEKQEFSGHETASQVRVYDRKVAVVDTLDRKIGGDE